ncbi:MAG: hypothetical protein ACI9FR_003185 [Cryomorphaceae bacterium]|jgi:hypothetical protein
MNLLRLKAIRQIGNVGDMLDSTFALLRFKILPIVTALIAFSGQSAALNYDGSIELEQRYFFDDKAGPVEDLGQFSARLQMEFFKDWDNGDQQLVFEPFLRLDAQDGERSHADIRQLLWSKLGKNYEFSAGLGRVFWGVTESQHLVDIINQTDNVENIDGEDKLGQPMIRYSYFDDFGSIDAFLLPAFRPRTFAGKNSRLNGGFVVDSDNELYEDSSEENNIDLAIRYSNTFGDWGVGLSWFKGTSREPDLLRFADFQNFSTTAYYPQIDQLGADIQLTTDAWLLKFEAIQRSFNDSTYEDFSAATLGAEYTLVGIMSSVYDLGLLAEYSWDERDQAATSIFQNDFFVGARLALNDISDSQVLFGISQDFDNSDSQAIFIEAATRVAPAVTINVELRHFNSDTPSDPIFRFRDDSFIQIGLEYFFD